MATINLTDIEADNLLSILRSLHFRPSLLDSIESQLTPEEAPVEVVEDPAPKKAKAKADPAPAAE